MSRRSSDQELRTLMQTLLAWIVRNPGSAVVLVALLGGVVMVWLVFFNKPRHSPNDPGPGGPAEGYLFCFWNVENLFDDRDDGRKGADAEYDLKFSLKPNLLEAKLTNLSRLILELNNGHGPDILCLAEVESERAADLLRQRLNRDLGDRAPPYSHLLFEEVRAGRHIAPAILTRLPVKEGKTQKLDNSLRILEGHITVNGHDLVVLASHWTSRRDGGESGRTKYADQLYRRYKALHASDPAVDLIVCGDFNDDPDDSAVERNLHAVDDRDRLNGGREPQLYNLFGPRWSAAKGKFGTATYAGRWHLYDQLVVSPGLLDDRGWSVVPESVAIAGDGMKLRNGRPWRFDDEQGGKHGYADHFPVTVRLKVAGK